MPETSSTSDELHLATRAVLRTGAALRAHPRTESESSLWRRLFTYPEERHYLDEIRTFVRVLGEVLDVSQTPLFGSHDVHALAAEVNQVVAHIEQHVDYAGDQLAIAQALVEAVYAVRVKHEEVRNALVRRIGIAE